MKDKSLIIRELQGVKIGVKMVSNGFWLTPRGCKNGNFNTTFDATDNQTITEFWPFLASETKTKIDAFDASDYQIVKPTFGLSASKCHGISETNLAKFRNKMENINKYPYKGNFGEWIYNTLPSDVEKLKVSDIEYGMIVLIRTRIFDNGEVRYMSEEVKENNIDIIRIKCSQKEIFGKCTRQ